MSLSRAVFGKAAAPGLALAIVVLAAPFATGRADPDAATKARLTHLLIQDCGSCHGLTMQGGLGKPLLPETLADRSAEILAEIILDGIPGTPMPPWRGQLTEDEARFLAETLKAGLTP